MKSKTKNLLKAMNVVAWVVFIGLMIKAVSVIISFLVSIVNPQASKDLYQGWSLSA